MNDHQITIRLPSETIEGLEKLARERRKKTGEPCSASSLVREAIVEIPGLVAAMSPIAIRRRGRIRK